MSNTSPSPLRDSAWAMALFNYSPAQRSAFWQFVYANGVPHVRPGKRKILFSEQAVTDWIGRRSAQVR